MPIFTRHKPERHEHHDSSSRSHSRYEQLVELRERDSLEYLKLNAPAAR